MGGSEHLSVREFESGIARIEARFDRTDARFDRLDDKVDGHSDRLTTLETVAHRGKAKSAGWSAAIAAVAIAATETVRRFWPVLLVTTAALLTLG